MVGVLGDDTDPMVTVMKLEKAPQETYADIGGLDQQIQEIKVMPIIIACIRVIAWYMYVPKLENSIESTFWFNGMWNFILCRNRLNFLSHILSIMRKWESNLPKVSFYMGPPEQVTRIITRYCIGFTCTIWMTERKLWKINFYTMKTLSINPINALYR